MTVAPIVVGMDGSPVSQAALLWAAHAAEAIHRPLLIVLAGDVVNPAERAHGASDPSAELLDSAVAAIRRAGVACDITTTVKDEQPAALFDQLSTSAALVVVGAGAEGRFTALITGSLSRHLQAHGSCAVVTVPPAWIGRPISDSPLVVVGIKPSPGGNEALRFAMSYASAAGSRVLAVRCWDRRAAADSGDPLAERDTQQHVLDDMIDAVSGRHPNVSVIKLLSQGPTHDVLRLAALSADLLVLGTRYLAGVKRSRLGPIADRLTRQMPCPVAVLSGPAPDGTFAPAGLLADVAQWE